MILWWQVLLAVRRSGCLPHVDIYKIFHVKIRLRIAKYYWWVIMILRIFLRNLGLNIIYGDNRYVGSLGAIWFATWQWNSQIWDKSFHPLKT